MLIETWKFCLDKLGCFVGALLMDLSKTFDTINHELLIATLQAYGFSTDVLEVLLSYLQDRVPQGSVFGPILFNIYTNNIFFELQGVDICNFADDKLCKFAIQT